MDWNIVYFPPPSPILISSEADSKSSRSRSSRSISMSYKSGRGTTSSSLVGGYCRGSTDPVYVTEAPTTNSSDSGHYYDPCNLDHILVLC